MTTGRVVSYVWKISGFVYSRLGHAWQVERWDYCISCEGSLVSHILSTDFENLRKYGALTPSQLSCIFQRLFTPILKVKRLLHSQADYH